MYRIRVHSVITQKLEFTYASFLFFSPGSGLASGAVGRKSPGRHIRSERRRTRRGVRPHLRLATFPAEEPVHYLKNTREQQTNILQNKEPISPTTCRSEECFFEYMYYAVCMLLLLLLLLLPGKPRCSAVTPARTTRSPWSTLSESKTEEHLYHQRQRHEISSSSYIIARVGRVSTHSPQRQRACLSRRSTERSRCK